MKRLSLAWGLVFLVGVVVARNSNDSTPPTTMEQNSSLEKETAASSALDSISPPIANDSLKANAPSSTREASETSPKRIEKSETESHVAQVQEEVRRPSWLTRQEQTILKRAKLLQAKGDDLTRLLYAEQTRARRVYAQFIARTLAERNRALQKVPHFWYSAMHALPAHEAFLSPRATPLDIDSGNDGGEKSQLVDDHHLLFHFLKDVRCHRVHGNSATMQHELEQHVLHGARNKQTDEDDDDEGVPSDMHKGTVGESPDLLDESFRLEFEFYSNPHFTNAKLFKQVSASLSLLFYDQIDDDDAFRGDARSPSTSLGIGNSVSWVGGDGVELLHNNAQSFFAIFDDILYQRMPPDQKRELQLRFGSLVSNVCTYLEHNPIAFFERRTMEIEHSRARSGASAFDDLPQGLLAEEGQEVEPWQ